MRVIGRLFSAPSDRARRHLSLCAAIFAMIFAFAHLAQAQSITVDPSQSIGPVPDFAGTGLAGTYYNPNYYNGTLATFLAPNICFPDCAGSSFSDGDGGLVEFTNGNATNIQYLTDIAPTNWSGSGLNINGYIAITQPGTYYFTISSDDSSSSVLAGQDFIGIPTCCQSQSGDATFSAAGLYAIAVAFNEGGGGSQLDFTVADSNENCLIGCSNGDGGYTNSGLFYSDAQLQGAPAPMIGGGWASLSLLALLGAGSLVRRAGHAV
jgi:hypothetical protein